MAGRTARIVVGRGLTQGLVWIVAGNAGECAAAIPEAGGARQVCGLMPHVPDVAPIGGVIEFAGFPVAGGAKRVQVCRPQALWIQNRSRRSLRLNMRGAVAVAGFA